MSNLAEHEAEQAAITYLCETGQCDHPECHDKPRVRYACPECGEESLYASDDVSLYWDAQTQDWAISDDSYPRGDSNLYCGNCDNVCEAKNARIDADRKAAEDVVP